MIDLSSDVSVAVVIAIALVVLFAGVIIGSRRIQATAPAAASTNDRLAAVENRMLEVEQKLNKISVEVQHLPTAETVAAMAVKIADIGGDVKALHTSVLATNRLVERIDQWLLTKGTGS